MTWYNNSGDMGDVVISTRARLARNISRFNFPPMLKKPDAEKIIDLVEDALSPMKEEFVLYRIDNMSEIKRQALVEKHMISPAFTGSFPRAVFISRDEGISIMVNEEDHLRIQCILPGFNPAHACDTVNKIDDLLNERLSFCFSEKYGFLTSCPTNVGTALRISAMLHLPGISMTGGINALLSHTAREGIAIRGIYGEGSEAQGNLYQISNQISLGLSESQLTEKLTEVVKNISETERSIRQKLNSPENPRLIDKIFRSHGALKNAYLMSAEELIHHINHVRLGIYLGIIDDITLTKLTELMITLSPANLSENKKLSSEERDKMRARLVKNSFITHQ